MTNYACVIDATGISAPSFDDILSGLQADFRVIFGDDAYLEPDSQDGQLLAIFANAINDSNNSTIDTYNSFSPATAQRGALASNIKLNGLTVQIPTHSTVVVTLVGTAGTVISNGIVQDNINLTSDWALPATVTIPDVGQINVTATAVDAGDIRAEPNTITRIVTSVPGWQTVTNPTAATAGAPVEADAAIRRRQSRSTAQPAQTIREAIYGGVANVVGVQRTQVYENKSGITDANGIPGHSISVVVEGGNVFDVATAIARRKTPGTGTFGDITEIIVDSHGVPDIITLFALIDVTIKVLVFITALPDYRVTTGDLIKTAVSYFLTQQDIGDDSDSSRLSPPIELSGTAAVQATGLPQDQLDILSRTYKLTAIGQARSDMLVTGGPYTAGATAVNIAVVNSIVAGNICYLVLDNGTYWKVTISSVVGNTLNFTASPIPVSRQVNTGTFVYVFNDLAIGFKEATTATTADVTVVVN